MKLLEVKKTPDGAVLTCDMEIPRYLRWHKKVINKYLHVYQTIDNYYEWVKLPKKTIVDIKTFIQLDTWYNEYLKNTKKELTMKKRTFSKAIDINTRINDTKNKLAKLKEFDERYNTATVKINGLEIAYALDGKNVIPYIKQYLEDKLAALEQNFEDLKD